MQQHEKLQYALIRMDIYRFKTVNEFCGRQQGDKLLQYIADCIREYESDMSVVGHLRADIFTICLPFKNKKQLSDIAVALHEKICAYPLFCKALPAFGICISKNHMDISLMCDYADMALQKIKGKAYAIYEFYDDKMRKEMMREKRIENNVAMALRDEEFKVYIQPKVDMRSGEIIGGEALIRWHSVKEGIIYPDEFIPVLEKSGYIVDVDAYVWEKVFAAIHIWKTGGITPVPISVNVSRSHVYQKSFAGVLEKLAQQYDVEPYYVPLEVTESMFTEYVDKLYKNITRLQSAGFRFSMDDFGAGYSSLNMLKDEPVDEVKIDRFFLKDIKKEKSQIVIRNVIHMIQELQLDMIVEGIETKEQAEKYLTLIGRRGKALKQGRDAIVNYQKTFDEINLQIRKHLLAYMFYRIFDNQMPNEPNLIAIWLRVEEKGLMRDLARTILNGDREWFEIICQKIREVADEVLKKEVGKK